MAPGSEDKKLVIFVNGKKKTSEEDGVTNPMSVTRLRGWPGLPATRPSCVGVRERVGPSETR